MKETKCDYFKSVHIGDRVTIHKVDNEKATLMFAENIGLPCDTSSYCKKNNIHIDAFSPIGWFLRNMTDYSDMDGIIDTYKSFSHMFVLHSGDNFWDVKATDGKPIIKRNSINYAIDIAMDQLIDAGIASVVNIEDIDLSDKRIFIRLHPSSKPI
jgi:hypothetical protein